MKYFPIALLLVFFAAAPALACECGPWRFVDDEFAHSRYVVVAELRSVTHIRKKRGIAHVSVFAVTRSFKGKYSEKDTITFRRYDDKSCVWSFEKKDVGGQYLFYVYDSLGKKNVSSGPTTCSRSGDMSSAASELPVLERLVMQKPPRKRK